MHSATSNLISHDKIIDTMAKLGYQNVKEGVCNGLAQMWIQAVLCDEEDAFNTRLCFICEDPRLLEKIARATAKQGRHLNDEERACIDVLAFFDGVQLYQNARLFSHLYKNKPHCLDAATIAKLTSPIKLDKAPIVEIYSENRMFNVYSLERYLNQLRVELELYAKYQSVLRKAGCYAPEIIIAAHSCTHKVALRYRHQTASWELADANQYPAFSLAYYSASHALLDALTEGFVAPVNISIFTTSINPLRELMQRILGKIKRQDPIPRLTACITTAKKTHLLALTAMRGDEARFVEIAKIIPNSDLWEYMTAASKIAAYHRQPNILRIIQRDYPDCLMRAEQSQEFLSLLITNNQHEFILSAIKWGAEIDEPFLNQPPLHIAVEADNLEALKILVQLGANLNLANEDGDTPFIYAIKLRRFSIIHYLIKTDKNQIESTNAYGNTPLMIAAECGSSVACDILLAEGANPNATNIFHETAAFITCKQGHKECLLSLIAHGVNLDLFDRAKCTPFFMCMVKQRWEMAAIILFHLKSLESFNPLSYEITMNFMSDILKHLNEHLIALSNEQKKRFITDVRHHRNALGLMLVKMPKNEFFTFFKSKEKQRRSYLHEIRKACKPTPVPSFDIDSQMGFTRI